MSNLTERLLQVAAIVFIGWFVWQLAVQSVVSVIRANNQANVAERALADCQSAK